MRPKLTYDRLEQDEAAEGHVVGLNLATGEPLDPVTCVILLSRCCFSAPS
jgi:hypothetical protein